MNAQHFDQVTHILCRVTARRRLLAGFALSPVAGFVARPVDDAEAKKKRKPKKAKPNAYGCLDVGKACRGDSSQCCSGICEGSKPKKGKKDSSRCVSHDAGICNVNFDFCSTGSIHFCRAGDNKSACTLTTGNAPFCGDFLGTVELCRECSRDTDCQDAFGPGAACVVLGGVCETFCSGTGRALCMPPATAADM